jgi:Family of unknown function (DUF6076)
MVSRCDTANGIEASRGKMMPSSRTEKWVKFPGFVRYANDRTYLGRHTKAHLEWAWRLSIPAIPRGGGSLWSRQDAWEQLRNHQQAFRTFLDAIIDSRDKPALLTPELMRTLSEHCHHVQVESRWDGSPEPVRRRSAQRYADREGLAKTLAVKGYQITPTAGDVTPPSRYHEFLIPADPLDGLYWELREFLRAGGGERLQQCPVCQRYFVLATARSQQYCATACRLKDNATRKAHNARYQQEFRARQREVEIKADLHAIGEAKAQLLKVGKDEPNLSWVLEEAGLSKRRWTRARQWEIQRYGKPRATELTS